MIQSYKRSQTYRLVQNVKTSGQLHRRCEKQSARVQYQPQSCHLVRAATFFCVFSDVTQAWIRPHQPPGPLPQCLHPPRLAMHCCRPHRQAASQSFHVCYHLGRLPPPFPLSILRNRGIPTFSAGCKKSGSVQLSCTRPGRNKLSPESPPSQLSKGSCSKGPSVVSDCYGSLRYY